MCLLITPVKYDICALTNNSLIFSPLLKIFLYRNATRGVEIHARV
jgi:hypothetical protein